MKRAAFAGVALLTAAACGGGGGEDAIHVSFYPTVLRLCASAGQSQYGQGNAWATLSSVPTDVARVNVFTSTPALNRDALFIEQVDANMFQVAVWVAAGVPIGRHDGTLSFELCRDAACTSKHALSGATLPYRVDIVESIDSCP